jgi:type IV secretion system protein TrbL
VHRPVPDRASPRQVGNGFGLIQGDVQTTFGLLVVISIGVSASALGARRTPRTFPAALIRKVLLFGFFAWLIGSWRDLTLTVIKGFAALGIKAGGGRMSVERADAAHPRSSSGTGCRWRSSC